jgi:predicted transcriptional regulator
VELAYLAVIQLLPARQRAVLLLRDVQGYSAAETASILELSVAAVTSALQRARATIAERVAARDADWSPSGITEADRALLTAFIEAHERQDPVAALAVIREDIRVAMPPNPGLFTGKEAIAGLMAHAYDRSIFGDWKLLPTAANRMPAAASYLRRAGSDVYVSRRRRRSRRRRTPRRAGCSCGGRRRRTWCARRTGRRAGRWPAGPGR